MTSSPRTEYHSWPPALVFACVAGCSSGSQTSPAPATSTTATAAAAAAPALLPLLAKNATRSSYSFDGGPAQEFLEFGAEKVKVSASCAKPDGTLDCDAMKLLRRGKTVPLTSAELGTGIAPGAILCKKLQIPSTVGRGPKGDEDGFCTFPDGSMVAHGSVDNHVLAP